MLWMVLLTLSSPQAPFLELAGACSEEKVAPSLSTSYLDWIKALKFLSILAVLRCPHTNEIFKNLFLLVVHSMLLSPKQSNLSSFELKF